MLSVIAFPLPFFVRTVISFMAGHGWLRNFGGCIGKEFWKQPKVHIDFTFSNDNKILQHLELNAYILLCGKNKEGSRS